MYLGMFLTLMISVLLGLVWSFLYSGLHIFFNWTILLHILAANFESAAEPFLVKYILKLDYKIEAKSQFVSVFVKTIVLYVLNNWGLCDSLLSFGVAQLVQSVIFIILILWFTKA